MKEIRRGQMYYARNGKDYMHKRGPGRPVIVVSNDTMNATCNRVMVIYLTTQDNGRDENVEVDCRGTISYAICNNINTIFKDTLQTYIGEVPRKTMEQIDNQILLGLGMHEELNKVLDESMPICIGCHEPEERRKLETKYQVAVNEAQFYKRAYDELLERVVPRP